MGGLAAFKAQPDMEPWFERGQTVVKFVAAGPGDRVVVGADGIRVNGRFWGRMWLEDKVGMRYEAGGGVEIREGYYLVLGTEPESLDGRYWGLLSADQLVGRAYALY